MDISRSGLYYYGARYYDSIIGRFISADMVAQDFMTPQTLNRYSYVLNNPLRYVDPSGNTVSVIERCVPLYYYCRAHYCPWLRDPCTYNHFVPGSWDNEVWEEICTMLSSDTWLEQQLTTELSQSTDLEKLIRLEQLKLSQAELRITKVQDGWEKGFYTPEEVQTKLTEHREAIAKAETEIGRLRGQMLNRILSVFDAELLRQELKELRN